MAAYAASKSFMQSFSQALYGELAENNIYVQTLVPGPTQTEFDQKAGAYQSALTLRESPKELVSLALTNIGSDEPVVVKAKGVFKQRFFAGLFPPKMVINEVKKMFKPPNNP
jgi:short-subunit dehydrogenase